MAVRLAKVSILMSEPPLQWPRRPLQSGPFRLGRSVPRRCPGRRPEPPPVEPFENAIVVIFTGENPALAADAGFRKELRPSSRAQATVHRTVAFGGFESADAKKREALWAPLFLAMGYKKDVFSKLLTGFEPV